MNKVRLILALTMLPLLGGLLPGQGHTLLFAQHEKPRNLPNYDYKVLRFGFTVGLNMMDMGIQRNYDAADFVYADVDPKLPDGLGFQVNAIADLRLADSWNLLFTPGIQLNSREVDFYNYNAGSQDPFVPADENNVSNPAFLGPAYLDFPLMLRYRSVRTNNVRPYLVSGLAFRYDLAGKKPGHFREIKETGEFNPIRFSRGELFYEIGFGLDNYSQYFKFAPEIRFAVGLLDISDQNGYEGVDNWAESISSARSFLVMLNFHFQ